MGEGGSLCAVGVNVLSDVSKSREKGGNEGGSGRNERSGTGVERVE